MNRPVDLSPIPPATQMTDIIRTLLAEINPEKILLLYAAVNHELQEDVFLRKPGRTPVNSGFIFLVLLEDANTLSSIKSQIACGLKIFRDFAVQLHFLDIRSVNQWVLAGDEYFNHIVMTASVWYDRGQIPLEPPRIFKS